MKEKSIDDDFDQMESTKKITIRNQSFKNQDYDYDY